MDVMSFRYDDTIKKELNYIMGVLNINQTEAIKEAIHSYYAILNQKLQPKSTFEIFKKTGFLEECKHSHDYSETYKKQLIKEYIDRHVTD